MKHAAHRDARRSGCGRGRSTLGARALLVLDSLGADEPCDAEEPCDADDVVRLSGDQDSVRLLADDSARAGASGGTGPNESRRPSPGPRLPLPPLAPAPAVGDCASAAGGGEGAGCGWAVWPI